jgi:hypothetical protein
MGRRLVTIATFDQAAQAQLAKNVLDEAGIQAAVGDENLVAMDWLLSNAVGGVKVQGGEEDADRAVAVLEEKLGARGEGLGTAVSPEELAAEAEAATPDAGEEPEPAERPAADEPEPPLSPDSRDEFARRGAFTAILGLMLVAFGSYYPVLGFACMLLVFYTLYLHFNAGFGEGALSRRGRLNLFVGGGITLANLGWLFLLFKFHAMS